VPANTSYMDRCPTYRTTVNQDNTKSKGRGETLWDFVWKTLSCKRYHCTWWSGARGRRGGNGELSVISSVGFIILTPVKVNGVDSCTHYTRVKKAPAAGPWTAEPAGDLRLKLSRVW